MSVLKQWLIWLRRLLNGELHHFSFLVVSVSFPVDYQPRGTMGCLLSSFLGWMDIIYPSSLPLFLTQRGLVEDSLHFVGQDLHNNTLTNNTGLSQWNGILNTFLYHTLTHTHTRPQWCLHTLDMSWAHKTDTFRSFTNAQMYTQAHTLGQGGVSV